MKTIITPSKPDGALNFQIPDVESVSPNDVGVKAVPSTNAT